MNELGIIGFLVFEFFIHETRFLLHFSVFFNVKLTLN